MVVREETLRALITAKETISNSMRDAAESTRDLRTAMAQAMSSSAAFAGAADLSEEEATAFARALGGLNREAFQGAAAQHMMAEGMDEAGDEAAQAAATIAFYKSQVDEAGDEAAEAAVQNTIFGRSLTGVASAAGEASVNLGPFNTSVKRAVVALPALIALVGSAAAVLGGLAMAATAAAGALALMFAGGILGRAEQLAATSSDLENRTEAVARIMKAWAEAMAEAIEPVQTLAEQQTAIQVLEGFVTLIGDLARSAKRLAPVFAAVGASLGPIFWANEAQGIAQLEASIVSLMPILENLAFYILENLPDLIAFLTEQVRIAGPAFGDFATSLIGVTAGLIEVGSTIFRLVLPALSFMLGFVSYALDLFNAIPDAAIAASLAFIGVAAALVVYGSVAGVATAITSTLLGALWSLIGTIAALLAPVTATVAAIAAIAAAVVLAISYFGWWDDILRALKTTWNVLVEATEMYLNILISFWSWVGRVTGAFQFLDWVIQKVVESFKWIAKQYNKHVKPLVDDFVSGLEKANEEAEKSGQIDLSGAKADTSPGPGGTGTGGGKQNTGGAAGPGGPSVGQRASGIQGNRGGTTIDMRGASFGEGTSRADVRKAVEEALRRRESRASDT